MLIYFSIKNHLQVVLKDHLLVCCLPDPMVAAVIIYVQ
jgi:hypothetical protein